MLGSSWLVFLIWSAVGELIQPSSQNDNLPHRRSNRPRRSIVNSKKIDDQIHKTFEPFDPVKLVETPNADSWTPNPNGTHAFSFIGTYDHDLKRENRALALIRLVKTDQMTGSIDDHQVILEHLAYSEAQWLDDSTILYLRPAHSKPDVPDLDPNLDSQSARKALENRLNSLPNHEGSSVELWVIQFFIDHRVGMVNVRDHYLVGSVPTTISNLKTLSFMIKNEAILGFFVDVYGPDYDDLAIWNVHETEDRFDTLDDGSSGKLYDSLYFRYWDSWIDPNGKSSRLYLTRLKFNQQRWSLSDNRTFWSAFPGLTIPSDYNSFDISGSSVVVTAKDPNLNPSLHTRQDIYIVGLFESHSDHNRSLDHEMTKLIKGNQGEPSNLVFSPLAKSSTNSTGRLAWLETRVDGYWADRNRVMVYDLETRQTHSLTENWDRSPSRIIWGNNENELYLLAEEHAKVLVFRILITDDGHGSVPISLTSENSVSDLFYLSNGLVETNSSGLLLTMSSLTSSNWPHVLTVGNELSVVQKDELGSKLEKNLTNEKLDPGESFWFEGDLGVKVHGMIVRPPGFKLNSKEKWPLLFLIHGGPEHAWTDSWSVRWNANVFAARGYIVSMINPTGSTGYGQDFTDSIAQNWGGRPYNDLVAGYRYLLQNFPEIDSNRTAALGASYGGYMVNWIMGHNAPFNFKAFVTHDGIVNTIASATATDDLFFPEHDFGESIVGSNDDDRQKYEKWNPIRFVKNWDKPCMVIHGGFDYRVPESEGLSVFNMLQRKGIPSRLLYFPDEDHYVLNPANTIRWYREIFKFFARWCPPGPI